MLKVLEAFGEPISHGGQESFVMNLINNMNLEGIHIDLLTPYYCDNTTYKRRISSIGGDIFTFGLDFKPGNSRFNICKYLDVFFRDHSYDVVHVHSGSISILGLFSYYAKKNGVKKVIVHSHCSVERITIKNKILRTIFSTVMKNNVDAYFACSKLAAEAKFTDSIVNNSVRIIKNGVNVHKFCYDEIKRELLRSELGYKENDFVIGNVGRFSYQKNHDFLIDIFSSVIEKENQARLLLVGDGELKKDIQLKVQNLGIEDRVIFTGNVDNVNDYMQAMDCFILTSRFEGLPIVGVEAQAMGLPCVFSDSITHELNITDLANFVSLDEKIDKWRDIILSYKTNIRKNMSSVITEQGYNVAEQADNMRRIYLNEV